MVRVRAGAREWIICPFFSLVIYKCGEHFRYTVSVSARDGLLINIQ